MPKRANRGAKRGSAKRQQSLTTLDSLKTSETEWLHRINSSDVAGYKAIQPRLKRLLDSTRGRIARLEKKCQRRGLKYKRKGAIACDCGNSFEAGGEYAFTCEECADDKKEERCTKCCAECEECAKKVCDKCIRSNAGCSESFCRDCLEECDRCSDLSCNRDKQDRSLIRVGYRGDSHRIYCVER